MKVNLSNFELKVLKEVARIPLGKVRSYQWLATKVGSPRATRAVGCVLRKNPFPLLIPCHRVIKSDGKLGGYSGGVRVKKTLLELEKTIDAALDNSLNNSHVTINGPKVKIKTCPALSACNTSQLG